MSGRDRAFRRAIRDALKKRRRSYWGRRDGEATPWMLGRVVDTPAACDCGMCCNPRRSRLYKGAHRRTMQERRALTTPTHEDL